MDPPSYWVNGARPVLLRESYPVGEQFIFRGFTSLLGSLNKANIVNMLEHLQKFASSPIYYKIEDSILEEGAFFVTILDPQNPQHSSV
ncbi:hypothetical protein [Itacaiunas virus]|uniref:Uncharacterized protein n=1 Tax=Itacaiunas virus TaxID=490111 RepID=A0A0D3R1B0_9RHAB|nr:hypothetical protein [Itacaiunas virus]AJR28287.1 hypothetical protein [Itacaiunas virus]